MSRLILCINRYLIMILSGSVPRISRIPIAPSGAAAVCHNNCAAMRGATCAFRERIMTLNVVRQIEEHESSAPKIRDVADLGR